MKRTGTRTAGGYNIQDNRNGEKRMPFHRKTLHTTDTNSTARTNKTKRHHPTARSWQAGPI